MIVIAGAGIVGAATAYAFRKTGKEVVILEKESKAGTGISSRNSGVIHAGLYYPKKSLKDELCRKGRAMLYQFCQEQGVAHRKTGKFLVAQNELEISYLHQIKQEAAPDVPLFFSEDLPAAVSARKALFSPESGILDVHGMILALIRESGASFLPGQEVGWVQNGDGKAAFGVNGEKEECEIFINACGLDSFQLAGQVFPKPLAKGSYFRILRKPPSPIESLIYPAIPKASPSLGTHLTIDLQGSLLLGPNLKWVQSFDYQVDEAEKQSFYEAARSYLPWLEPEDLEPGYVGYRPKLAVAEYRDFSLVREGSVLHCLGIESPGITASLALGEHIVNLLAGGAL